MKKLLLFICVLLLLGGCDDIKPASDTEGYETFSKEYPP